MKKKQIEEMAKAICDNIVFEWDEDVGVTKVDAKQTAENFYNIGYRKQSEGEWLDYPSDAYMKCSVCRKKYLKENMPKVVGYCPNPNCGAKMKGDCEHREWFGDMALHYCKKDREICEDVSKCTKGGEG